MHSAVRRAGQTLRGEESLQGRGPGEGVGVQGEDVDLAGDRPPDQLTRGVVTQVQLRGQHEEVNRQPRPAVVRGQHGVKSLTLFTSAQQILRHKLVLERVSFSLRFLPLLFQMEGYPHHL